MELVSIIISIISAIIAISSIVVSIIVWKKTHKRELTVSLYYVAFYENYRLVLTNTGYRPITITNISISIQITGEDGKVFLDNVPTGWLFLREEDENKLPCNLKDGESVYINLSGILSQTKINQNEKLDIIVYDALGNTYKPKDERIFNPKWGNYE